MEKFAAVLRDFVGINFQSSGTRNVSEAADGQIVKGLRNLGNTCFMNSVLQSLASCPVFVEHLRALQAQVKVGPFTLEVLKCLTELRLDGVGSFNPRSIFYHLAKANAEFRGNAEQDALELLETVLFCLKEENAVVLKALRVKETMFRLDMRMSIIPKDCSLHRDVPTEVSLRTGKGSSVTVPAYANPFEGWMNSHLECQGCRARAGESSLRWMPTRHQVFTTLPLPLPSDSLRKRTGSQKITIYDCLDEFFQQEALSGVTCSACSLQSTIAAAALRQKAFGDGVNGRTLTRTETSQAEDDAMSMALEHMLRGLEGANVIGEKDSCIQDFDQSLSDAIAAAVDETLAPTSDDDCTTIEDEEEVAQLPRLPVSCVSPAGGRDLKGGSGGSSPTSSEGDAKSPTDAGRTAEGKSDEFSGRCDADLVRSAVSVMTATSTANSGSSGCTRTTIHSLGRKSQSPRSLAQFSALFSPTALAAESVASPPSPPPLPSAEELERMLLSLRSPVRTDAVKLSAISRLPRLLCIYLNRRVYDAESGKMRKRMEHVSFPLVLNMQAYCRADGTSSSGSGLTSSSSRHGAGLPRSAFTGGLLAGVVPGITGMPMFGQYALRAVVEHMGSAETGHYVAHCLVQRGGERVWEYCSDERHHRVTEARVLQTQATMLFYERLPSS